MYVCFTLLLSNYFWFSSAAMKQSKSMVTFVTFLSTMFQPSVFEHKLITCVAKKVIINNFKWHTDVLKCCLVHLWTRAAESEARSRREFAGDETNGGLRPEAGQRPVWGQTPGRGHHGQQHIMWHLESRGDTGGCDKCEVWIINKMIKILRVMHEW